MKRQKYMHLAAESHAFVTPFSGKVPFALQSYRIIDHLWPSNRVKAHENPYNTWTLIPVSKWSKKHVCIYAVYIYLYILCVFFFLGLICTPYFDMNIVIYICLCSNFRLNIGYNFRYGVYVFFQYTYIYIHI